MESELIVSLRECRLVLGRVLRVLGVPRAAVPAIRDTALVAESAGLGGIAALHAGLEALRSGAHRTCRWSERGEVLEIDADGRHAFAVAPDLLDLAAARCRRAGSARLRVTAVAEPGLLRVLEHQAPAQRLSLDFANGEIRARPGPGSTRWPLDPLLHNGTRVDPELWWSLYRLAGQALTPDSAASRRHAGRSLFDELGNIVGEVGEDAAEPVGAAEGT
ncbi:hypothetical protein [Sciscionella sediminilitoris]|uniref:hypothetical protein n=1 Tax=Sciscionella sediminilitoris TaxID=1445613 RepID=UPI0004DF6CC8|nr:hypothetical protein [Sciscionella sp. SE31]